MSTGLFDKFKSTLKTTPSSVASEPMGFRNSLASSLKMDDATFAKYRDFVYQQSGIYFTENKKYLLEGRIAKRIEANHLTSFDDYFRFLSSPSNLRTELPGLFEAITINETYFFRNPPQFEAMENIIIPELLKDKSQFNRKLRVWSAASSSGEEAYTIAMIFLEKIKPKFPGVQIEIIGTDINNAVIDRARSGVYKEYAIRNMPQNYLQKYFAQDGDKYILKPEVKQLVKFNFVNLFDKSAMRMMSKFDLVFCCNVLIYFDMQSKQQVVADLYDALNPNSYLFIGYSESLHGITKAFKLVHFPKTIAYKKEL